jgi:class 3 adenylate cyclase
VVPLTIVFLLLVYTDTRRVAAEARVDELLTNAIPASIAARLRHGERRIAESYAATSVVFADLVGFTPWANARTPAEVVATLDSLFTRFDASAERHGLEKIKTIGDAYLAVAGAPEPMADHAIAAVEFAREILATVASARAGEGAELEMRVGIASGPVVGAVIGDRRMFFDLWGDTVNTAERVESAGIPGRVHLSESTAALLPADRYALEPREAELKGLGRLRTYLDGQPTVRTPRR